MTLPFSGGLLGFGSSATQGASPFHWVELGRKKITADGDSVLVTGADADATFTEDFSEATPTTWTEDSSSGYENNLEPYKSSTNGLWFDMDYASSTKTSGTLDLSNTNLMGSNLNNTKWTMRFKINFTVSTGSGTVWIGFSDNQNASNGSQRFAGVRAKASTGFTNGSDNGGQALTTTNRTDGGTSSISTGTDYYVTCSRTGANEIKTTISTNSDYSGGTTLTATTLETATDDLKYFKVMNHMASGSGQIKGYLYDLKFYNGISSVAGDLASKPYIQILQHNFNTGAVRTGLRFNEDGGSNYTGARSVNGSTTQSDNNGIDSIRADTDVDGSDFTISTFMNDTSMEKLGTLYRVHQSGSGATNAPEREEMAVKWSDKTEAIGKVESYNKETGSFTSGSECVVLGFDPDAEEGTQFWEQVKSVELSSSDEIDYGDFDGSNDHISFGTKFDQMQQEGSFSVWIKPDNAGAVGNDIIFDNSDYSSLNNGFGIRISDPSGGKAICTYGIWGSTDGSISTSAIWASSEWQHLVVTYDGTTGKIYRNGTLVKSGALTANSGTATYNARLGFSANGNDHRFHGKMSQALVYNDALTSTEVTALYNNGTPTASPSTSGLVSWYKLDGDANDSHGSNNGTNTGVSFGSEMPNILDTGDFSTAVEADFDLTATGSVAKQNSGSPNESRTLNNGQRTILSQKFDSGNSLIGTEITQLVVQCRKDSGSPTGTLYAYIYADSDDSNPKATSPTTYDASTFPSSGSHEYIVFNFPATTIAVNDSVALKFEGGSSGNQLNFKTINNSNVANETFRQKNGGSWSDISPSTEDLWYIIGSGNYFYQVGTEIVKTDNTITATNAGDDNSSGGGSGSDRVYTALPEKLSNTQHITDFDFKITANAPSGDPDIVPIMYTAGTRAFSTSNSQDGFGVDVYSDSSLGNNYTMRAIEKNGTDNDYSTGINIIVNTQYYCRLKRNSSTVGTMEVYTDSARTTHASGSPQTLSITGGTGGADCTHLQSSTWSQSVHTSYVVKNVKLYNNKVSTINSKKYLWVQTHIPQSTTHGYLYFNGDDGSTNNNYARRGSVNGGGSDFANADDDEINWSHDTNTSKYLNLFLVNDPAKEKLGLAHYADYGGSGSGNAPNRMEFAYKWDNTSDPIKSIRLYNQKSGTLLPVGTRLIVWGAD